MTKTQEGEHWEGTYKSLLGSSRTEDCVIQERGSQG